MRPSNNLLPTTCIRVRRHQAAETDLLIHLNLRIHQPKADVKHIPVYISKMKHLKRTWGVYEGEEQSGALAFLLVFKFRTKLGVLKVKISSRFSSFWYLFGGLRWGKIRPAIADIWPIVQQYAPNLNELFFTCYSFTAQYPLILQKIFTFPRSSGHQNFQTSLMISTLIK